MIWTILARARAGKAVFFLLWPLVACARPPAAAGPTRAAGPTAVVVMSTALKGYLGPCGCTSNPLGGVAKLASRLGTWRARGLEPALVTTGDFLLSSAVLSAPAVRQEEAKAELLAALYKELGVVAQVPGAADLGYKGGAWRAAIANPWLLGQDGEAPVVVERNGVTLGFIAVPRDGAKPDALSQRAALARARGAELVIALSGLPWTFNRKLATTLAGVDVLVSGGDRTPRAASLVGKTLLVEAGDQGQWAGELEIHRTAKGASYAAFDFGEGERQLLARQLAALASELEAAKLPSDHPGRIFKERRMAELRAQDMALANLTPPAGNFLRFRAVPLERTIPDDPPILARVAAHNAKLCDWSAAATKEIPCPPLPEGQASYLGNRACAGCHPAELAQWRTTKHAQAVKTLEDAGQLCDLGCIGCHTVGYGKPGGFCSPQRLGALGDVGCEECHGPGSRHVASNGSKSAIARDPGGDVCIRCHTREHSDLFELEKYRARILGPGHGQ